MNSKGGWVVILLKPSVARMTKRGVGFSGSSSSRVRANFQINSKKSVHRGIGRKTGTLFFVSFFATILIASMGELLRSPSSSKDVSRAGRDGLASRGSWNSTTTNPRGAGMPISPL